jgi:hypothetical protein
MSPAADDMIPCAFAPPLAEASAVAPLSDLPHPTANTTKLNNVHPAESGRANFQYIFSLPCFGDQGAIRPIYQSEGLDHFPPQRQCRESKVAPDHPIDALRETTTLAPDKRSLLASATQLAVTHQPSINQHETDHQLRILRSFPSPRSGLRLFGNARSNREKNSILFHFFCHFGG